jgi:hypothetical protein
LTSIFAVLPVLMLFILLGGVRLAAQWADIVVSLAATAALVGLLRIWEPSEPLVGEPDGAFEQPAVAGGEGHNPAMEAEVNRRDDTRRIRRATSCAPTPPT